MFRASNSRRASVLWFGLALLLAGEFTADTAGADAVTGSAKYPDSKSAGQPDSGARAKRNVAVEATEPLATSGRGAVEPERRSEIVWPARLAFLQQNSRSAQPGGLDRWSIAAVGVTLVLAGAGVIAALLRRNFAQTGGATIAVISRVHLSPKHTVYLLRVGRRVLLVGTGPHGAPALIGELDELADLVPELSSGARP